MTKLFKNKKVVILSIVLAVIILAGVGILAWQLTKNIGTYTVKFETNGGNEIESIEVEKGTVLSREDLPIPSKRGEMFLAWNTDRELTKPYWDEPIEDDMTFYASYIAPIGDEQVHELVQSVIPYASTDFSVTVRSTVELTNENVGEYIELTVNYGHHENGGEIKLSVALEGEGIYRISGNYAKGGEYVITLLTSDVTFNPEDELLSLYGLTEALRILRFRIVGDAYLNGVLSDKVADIPEDEIAMTDINMVTVKGEDRKLIGATEAENGVVRIGDGDDISNYYKILKVESTTDEGITYSVRPAEYEEVYDKVFGYDWQDIEEDDIVINEDIKDQVIENLVNNEQLNNYVQYIALASTYTPTYRSLSMHEFGEVVADPMFSVVLPSGIEFEVKKNAFNDNFDWVIGEDKNNKFVKLAISIPYEVKLAKVGSKGSLTAEIKLKVEFWIYFGMGGQFELGWGEYDIDYGASVMTQTAITFSVTLMTSDARRLANIDDEIEAIYNSAKEPTPENLLEQYNDLMSGGSKPIEIFNQDIFEVPVLSMLGGLVKISVPIRFVVSVDVEASFTSYFTVLTGNAFGIVGDDEEGLDAYFESLKERYLYRMELKGHVEVRAGAEIGVQISLGYRLATVSLNAQAGVYGELYGYFFYEIDRMNTNDYKAVNQGGAYYFEFGVYIDIRLRAEVCHIKYSGSLWDKKWPIYSKGQKEIVYGFANPTSDVITMEGDRSVNITETGVLDVYVFDITEERSATNPRIVEDYPFDASEFEFSFSNDNFKFSGNQIQCVGSHNIGSVFEAKMTVKYTGIQMNFREAITKYVKIRYSKFEDMDWDNADKTVKLDFTIGGKVIFTRDFIYGERISLQPFLFYKLEDDGSENIGFITDSEAKAINNAGFMYARWNIIEDTTIIITEDSTVEAEFTVRRKWKVNIVEDGVAKTILEADDGADFILPDPQVLSYSTPRHNCGFYAWMAEDGTFYRASTYYKLTSDLTLTPYYTQSLRYYNVIFDANGGTINSGDKTFKTSFAYGAVPHQQYTPERKATEDARYEFTGWSPMISPVTGETTYKAQWREIKYHTVTFSAGEGQFDEEGNKTVTLKVEEGHILSEADFPIDPHLKADGGYYEFDSWSAAVSAGTVITGDVTYTASYKNELTRKTGITVSDGVNTEDIAVFLEGKNKVSGYSYTVNTEFNGNMLEITAPGLTISGSGTDINITVLSTEVTLHDLTLTQNERIAIIDLRGKATANISGTVKLTASTDAEAIRGDYNGEYGSDNGGYNDFAEADILLRGMNAGSKLIVNGKAYGIAVYGELTLDNLIVEINMPSEAYKDPVEDYVYDTVALQVPSDTLTVNNSDIFVNYGVVNSAWLSMTSSLLKFTAEKFTENSYTNGLYISNWYALTEQETLIALLKNSQISFAGNIAIAIVATVDEGDPEDFSDDTYFTVNTTVDSNKILKSYRSFNDFISDVEAYGYDKMIEMDASSSIE